MPQASMPRAPSGDQLHDRQPFHRPRTSMAPIAHMLNTAINLSPLAIAEFVKDPDRRWRVTRIAVLTGTLISQGLWAAKVSHDRKRCQEQRERG